mgnify:FL=1
MLIDMHAHLWDGHFEENKRQILTVCESYGVSKVLVSSLGGYYPDEEEIARLNRATHQFLREEPSLIEGYCYVNPGNPDAPDVLKKGIEEYGMSGMKLWVATFCDDPRVFPLIERCIDYKVPVLIHTFYKAVGQLPYESLGSNVAALAARYPEAKLLMAHMGADCLRELKPIQPYPNVSVDTSGSIFRRDDIDYAKKLLGADRIVFGTDMPGISFLLNYGQIEEADLTPDEKKAVFGGNALRLLKRS